MEYTVRCVVRVELKSSRPAQGGDARARLESHVHDLMGELEHRWVSDSQVEVDFTSCEATILIAVEAGDRQRAMSKAWGVLSMAVHAAGGATLHRPFPPDAEWSVSLLKTEALPRSRQDRTAAALA